MIKLLDSLILFFALSDRIPVVALPVFTQEAPSATSIYTGYTSVVPLSTSVADTSQPVLGTVKTTESIRGLSTTRSQPEKSEQQQQETTDPAPCDMVTGTLGPTDDANGPVDATKSTIASSQMNVTVTPDATTSVESFVVASTPGPNSQDGFRSTSTKFAAEPSSTVIKAPSWMNASDTTTRTMTITPGSSSTPVAAESTSTVRLTIMATSTVGAGAATETSRIPTTTMTAAATTTTESVEIDCPDESAATPKSHRHRRSNDRCQHGSSSAGKSGPAWWETIPIPPALLLWSQSMMTTFGTVYYAVHALATVGRMMSSCVWPRSQPHDSIDRPREGSRSGCGRHAVKDLTDAAVHDEDLEKGNSCNDCDAQRRQHQPGSEEKQSKTC